MFHYLNDKCNTKKRVGRYYDDNLLLPANKKRILSLPNDENKPYAVDKCSD